MRLRLRGAGPTRAATGRQKDAREIHGDVAQPPAPPHSAPRERILNVVFNYNGESWDAYEVLGLPAGSSAEQVEKAYREGLERIDETSRAFFETAVRAIRQAHQAKKVS